MPLLFPLSGNYADEPSLACREFAAAVARQMPGGSFGCCRSHRSKYCQTIRLYAQGFSPFFHLKVGRVIFLTITALPDKDATTSFVLNTLRSKTRRMAAETAPASINSSGGRFGLSTSRWFLRGGSGWPRSAGRERFWRDRDLSASIGRRGHNFSQQKVFSRGPSSLLTP